MFVFLFGIRLCEMGCYGIGVSRLMQTIIEHSLAVNNGKMIWPVSIAPMNVCITPLGNKKVKKSTCILLLLHVYVL